MRLASTPIAAGCDEIGCGRMGICNRQKHPRCGHLSGRVGGDEACGEAERGADAEGA